MPDRVRIEVRRGDLPATALDVHTLRVVDEAGSHLLAKATTMPSRVHDFTEGDPVQLTWGFMGTPVRSLMYVHRVADTGSRRRHETEFSLTLVGASWPLKSANQRVFRRHSAASILRSIAAEHGLASSFTAVNRDFGNFISRESDWVGLRDLARRCGGLLRVDGTTIRIFDMGEGLARLAGAPVFSPSSASISEVRTAKSRGDTRRRVVTMVHPDTKDVITVDDTTQHDDDVLPLVERPSYSVESPNGVQQSLRADRLSERFHETATIRSMKGSPRLRPGEVVGLRGMTKGKNGYWTVTKAEHSLEREGPFTTSLEMGRGAAHPRETLPTSHNLTSPGLFVVSGAAMRQGKWVAT